MRMDMHADSLPLACYTQRYIVPNWPCPSSTDSGTTAAFASADDICIERQTSTTQIRAEGDGVRHERRLLLPWQSLILCLFRGRDMLAGHRYHSCEGAWTRWLAARHRGHPGKRARRHGPAGRQPACRYDPNRRAQA